MHFISELITSDNHPINFNHTGINFKSNHSIERGVTNSDDKILIRRLSKLACYQLYSDSVDYTFGSRSGNTTCQYKFLILLNILAHVVEKNF